MLASSVHYFSAAEFVDEALDRLIPAADVEPKRLHEAMRWSTFAGGKRFRPMLVFASGKLFGIKIPRLLNTAAAVEMMHTFSLIHDDLPAMDNDELRRGKPTCHIKFDEATAILAGDGLQTLAFKAISDDELLDASMRLRLVSELAAATGTPTGMVAGQQLDIEAEGREVDDMGLEAIHRAKTGALIRFSAIAGAIIGSADEAEFAAIERFADRLGLLFQITDDVLDATKSSEVLGKTAGKDAAMAKATYVSIHGVEEGKRIAEQTFNDARDAIASLGSRADDLVEIARMTLLRSS